MSQESTRVRITKLCPDNPRVNEQRENKDTWTTSPQMHEQKKSKGKAQKKRRSSLEIAGKIERNAKWIKTKIREIKVRNARKRKAALLEKEINKKRRIKSRNYRVIRGKQEGKPSFLVCSSRRGGPEGIVHTHEWRTILYK
ncbi:uncharacterized protein VP01_973g4 [Puccinia sorghi]|uniref:Uncharacterized protein n=1 Tax=Puccinia sorghi TaxID=27349 RepID=A0A0L6U5W4_9BASI|nr:uncharacterized protein VP01_973g4 [Puccinia sorghi]